MRIRGIACCDRKVYAVCVRRQPETPALRHAHRRSREARTHPEVRQHIQALREGLIELTESVLDVAVEHVLSPVRRRQAAHTFVAVLLDEANARSFDGPVPDVHGAAHIICGGLVAPG